MQSSVDLAFTFDIVLGFQGGHVMLPIMAHILELHLQAAVRAETPCTHRTLAQDLEEIPKPENLNPITPAGGAVGHQAATLPASLRQRARQNSS